MNAADFPSFAPPSDPHYAVVADAIHYLCAHAERQPALPELARAVQLSEAHLQRVFSEWAGISPKRFLQYLAQARARQALRSAADVLAAAHAAGLSGPGRLHDLMITCEAMTPGEIRQGGAGVTLHYGFAASPFGTALLGWTARGLSYLAFCAGDEAGRLAELVAQWPAAQRLQDEAGAAALIARIFPVVPQRGTLHLVLRGSNFQLRVWEALLRTMAGERLSYGQLAEQIGAPRAARAVGSALAANSIGYLIPCHRVIRESGVLGQYRWGSERKLAMQLWEEAGTAPAGGE